MKFSTRDIVKLVLTVLVVYTVFQGVLYVADLARTELVWFGIAFFLAVALNPAVSFLTRWMPKRNRGLAIGSVFIIGLVLIGFFLASLIPPIVDQSQHLAQSLPGFTDQIARGSGPIPDFIRQYSLIDRVRESQSQIGGYLSSAGTEVVNIVRQVFSSFIAAITILGLTFFMLLEGPGWLRSLSRLVPTAHRTHTEYLVSKMYRSVTGYVNGNLLTSLVAALATAAMLAIVHIPYAIPLGIFVGIMDLLPLVGATIGAVVVIIVALFISAPAAIAMAIFFGIYQQLENHVLQPLIYGKTVEISPLVVLVAVLVGSAVGGIVGAIVAIPIFASLQILVKDYFERHFGSAEATDASAVGPIKAAKAAK